VDFYSFACHVEGDRGGRGGRGQGGWAGAQEKRGRRQDSQGGREIGENYADLCNIP